MLDIQNNRGRGGGYQPKPKAIIVLLHIKRKKLRFCFFTDGKQHKARELDMITLRNHTRRSYMA